LVESRPDIPGDFLHFLFYYFKQKNVATEIQGQFGIGDGRGRPWVPAAPWHQSPPGEFPHTFCPFLENSPYFRRFPPAPASARRAALPNNLLENAGLLRSTKAT
jgi:hypothetical protein